MSPLERVHAPERMDELTVQPAELDRSLRDLRDVNRWLGATRVMLRAVGEMARRLSPPVLRVLDVATGSADIPLALARWADARKIEAEIVATDFHPQTLEFARRHTAAEDAVRVEEANALDLPYGRDAFHFALCSTALHHFDWDDAVRVLRELDRVASHGIVVGDLRRSRAGLWGARLLAATVWRRHPVTRHDGPLSVQRAFTPEEMRRLAREAGLKDARVRTHPMFRLSLVVDRTETEEDR